jgi:hypothetical protein
MPRSSENPTWLGPARRQPVRIGAPVGGLGGDLRPLLAHSRHVADWGVSVAGPDLDLSAAWDAQLTAAPAEDADEFDDLIHTWLPLTYALNAENRSMGKDDLCPFVLAPAAVAKLRFVHVVVSAVR